MVKIFSILYWICCSYLQPTCTAGRCSLRAWFSGECFSVADFSWNANKLPVCGPREQRIGNCFCHVMKWEKSLCFFLNSAMSIIFNFVSNLLFIFTANVLSCFLIQPCRRLLPSKECNCLLFKKLMLRFFFKWKIEIFKRLMMRLMLVKKIECL